MPDGLVEGCQALIVAPGSDPWYDGQTVTVSSVDKQYAWIILPGRTIKCKRKHLRLLTDAIGLAAPLAVDGRAQPTSV